MTYITSVERMSEKKGWQQGLRQSIVTALRVRFGEPPESLAPQLKKLEEVEKLQTLLKCVLMAETLTAVMHQLTALTTTNNSAPQRVD